MNGLAFWIQDNFLMKKDATPGASVMPSGQVVILPKPKDSDDLVTYETDENPTKIDEPLL